MYYVNAAISIAVLTMPCWLLLAWAVIAERDRRDRKQVKS